MSGEDEQLAAGCEPDREARQALLDALLVDAPLVCTARAARLQVRGCAHRASPDANFSRLPPSHATTHPRACDSLMHTYRARVWALAHGAAQTALPIAGVLTT
eukprot:314783-Prymnesium_polylepis.1